MFQTFKKYLELIKFSHSIFALPFALLSALIAFENNINWSKTGLIILAMVLARSAAMAFNRLVDANIDAKNPRTKTRHLPAGLLSRIQVVLFIFFCAAGFWVTCYFINQLAFFLSFPTLLVLFFYSYTKRFTAYSHLFLGLALAISPLGAWVAIRGEIFNLIPLLLFGVVLFWVAGFDVLYSLQDYTYDKKQKLNSIPVKFGKKNAIRLSRLMHFMMFVFYLFFLGAIPQNVFFGFSAFFVAGALIYQHTLVKENDLTRLDQAFFSVNGYLSISLLIFYCLATWMQ